MRISVVGAGYVGLVTGACLAEIGHEVVCTDNDAAKIQTLESGSLPIYEPGLEGVVDRARKQGRLSFRANPADAVAAGDAIFICVGTPPLPDGDADLSAIDHVARLVATEAKSPKLVIEKSTVPARTGQELKRALAVYGRKTSVTFRVASNPEFLREGTAVADFLHPDRIVVGVEDEMGERQLKDIYQPVLERKFHCPVHASACPDGPAPAWLVTTINSAELIKHASNSFLALKISYANMVADLAERLGADIGEVTRAMGMDPRIGPSFLSAGLGFGGFCLPKDLQAFVHLAERSGVDFTMLKEAEKVNRRRIDRFFEKIREALWVVRGKQIGVLGLAFKPNTDDIRFAPAIDLINRLTGEGARVRAYDPEAAEKARAVLPDVEFAKSAYEAAQDSEALVIATEWDEFRKLDWERLREAMARPLILDGRNLLSPCEMRKRGFEYRSFGRPD
ncbi:MAG TPA: UDP-glucose/GDP-mannose dehydrogenase family protein [Candidatus Polarisedimenticolia bacterium]|nr:UDP-glucose/GDP-mannose dehydrogenase family protein [Candidatus Polarisedimenticolia bacterium]